MMALRHFSFLVTQKGYYACIKKQILIGVQSQVTQPRGSVPEIIRQYADPTGCLRRTWTQGESITSKHGYSVSRSWSTVNTLGDP